MNKNKSEGDIIISSQHYLEALAPSRIGFLGGSFNPVHKGHIALAEHVLESYLDYVVLCPHSLNPDKKDILLPIESRINMLLIMRSISPYSNRMFTIHPSFIEGTHGEPFINLCRNLQSVGCHVSIICGVDVFSRPYYPDLCQFDHYVGIRDTAFSKEKICSTVKGDVTFFETPYDSLSSTQIRRKIYANEMSEIHENLEKYINDNTQFQ